MFSKHSEVPTSFASTWKTEQLLETGSTQTDDIVKKEEECQVIEQVEVGIQTEEEEPKNYQRSEYDEASLSAFLKRVTPKVIRELERQNRSQAFHGYSVVKEEESLGVKMLHSLRWNQLDPEGVVTGIDWSCTGSVIGVSYGSSYHDDWCDHKGAVAVWNINRSDFDANQPERVIEASSCVLSLAFHPTNPAVFAAGTFSGAYSCVLLQGQDIPRGIRTHMDGSSGVGISSASFNTEDSMLFVLGAEGGGLFLCSTSSEVPTGVEFGGVGLMRCVTSTLASHSGRVITAQFSPHHRNAVLSAASDNQIRLFTLLQPNKPVSVIHSEEAIACVRWSPSRPLVVAVGRVTGEAAFMKLVAVGDQLGRVCVWHLPNSAVSPLSTELSNLHTILDTLAD
ncbi:WD repeat-containing protein 34-like [Homarus americanus]|uniref:WD repeat-containing protein 34-like n=1 Tax=Homarus americanus TaxID=6706 RepID=A0A8J5N448_HOMAM|nr:WD repeat-containing protein 34-like [Homarus americanus]